MAIYTTFLSLLLLIVSASSIRVEINNIHNGFKLVLEGKPQINGDDVLIASAQVLEDTLTSNEDLSSFLQLNEAGALIKIGQLLQIREIEEQFTPLVIASWTGRASITVGFIFPEEESEDQSNEELYQHLRTKTLPPSEQF